MCAPAQKGILKVDDRSFLYEFLRDWADALLRRKAAVVAIMTFCVVLGLAYAFLVTSKWRAEVRILPPQGSRSGSAFLSQISAMTGFGGLGGESDGHAMYPEIARSRDVVTKALVSVYEGQPFLAQLTDRNVDDDVERALAIQSVTKMLNGYVDPITGIVTLEFVHESRNLVAPFLNAVLQELEKFYESRLVAEAAERQRSINSRLDEVAKGLEASENEYRAFLERNRGAALPPGLDMEKVRLRRAVDVNSALFTELMRQLEIAKIEEVGNLPTLDVFERPIPPIRRHSPQRFLVLAFAAILGAVISMVYVRYRDVHDAYSRS